MVMAIASCLHVLLISLLLLIKVFGYDFLGRHPYYMTGLHRGALLHGHRQGQEDFRPPDDRQRGGSSR
jgi:hypothetical protein